MEEQEKYTVVNFRKTHGVTKVRVLSGSLTAEGDDRLREWYGEENDAEIQAMEKRPSRRSELAALEAENRWTGANKFMGTTIKTSPKVSVPSFGNLVFSKLAGGRLRQTDAVNHSETQPGSRPRSSLAKRSEHSDTLLHKLPLSSLDENQQGSHKSRAQKAVASVHGREAFKGHDPSRRMGEPLKIGTDDVARGEDGPEVTGFTSALTDYSLKSETPTLPPAPPMDTNDRTGRSGERHGNKKRSNGAAAAKPNIDSDIHAALGIDDEEEAGDDMEDLPPAKRVDGGARGNGGSPDKSQLF